MRREGFIHFPRALIWRKTQTAQSRICTLAADSISHVEIVTPPDNHNNKVVSKIPIIDIIRNRLGIWCTRWCWNRLAQLVLWYTLGNYKYCCFLQHNLQKLVRAFNASLFFFFFFFFFFSQTVMWFQVVIPFQWVTCKQLYIASSNYSQYN